MRLLASSLLLSKRGVSVFTLIFCPSFLCCGCNCCFVKNLGVCVCVCVFHGVSCPLLLFFLFSFFFSKLYMHTYTHTHTYQVTHKYGGGGWQQLPGQLIARLRGYTIKEGRERISSGRERERGRERGGGDFVFFLVSGDGFIAERNCCSH